MIDGFGRAVHAQQITSLDGVELGEETAVARGHGQCCGLVLHRAGITWASAHEQVPAAQQQQTVLPDEPGASARLALGGGSDPVDDIAGAANAPETDLQLSPQTVRLSPPGPGRLAVRADPIEHGGGTIIVLGQHQSGGDCQTEGRFERPLLLLQRDESPQRRGIVSAIALEQDPHGLGELSLTVVEGILRCFGQLHQFLRVGILASFAVAECQRQLQAGDFGGSLRRFTSAPRHQQ